MTIEELEKANNIKRELDRCMRHKEVSNNCINFNSCTNTSVLIELGGMGGSTDWSIYIDRDEKELIRELFETIKAFSEKRITELNNQFAKL